MKLWQNALIKFVIGILLLAALLFIPAGTVNFPNAWLFMALLFVPMLILGAVLLKKSPALLEKRLNHKEQEQTQKQVVSLSGILFLIMFIISGLDFRFKWTSVPTWLVIAASIILVLSYAMYAEVMRENAYLSRTVEVQKDQKVIDTGLYGIVRHPMYSATVFLFLSMPLVLGSWIAFFIMLLYPVILAFRIRNEEQVLESGLAGYAEYKKKVKYRLFPFVW